MPGGMQAVTPWSDFEFGSNATGPYPDRQLPSWMPTMDSMTRELQNEYGHTREAFDTSGYDTASTRTEQNVLTSGLNAGNNAASAYANKARQAGGSGLGAGLVKAEAVVGGRRAAGDIALEREKYDIQQREGAATQAATIASQLGDLRNRYLSSLVSYTTSEDATAAAHQRDLLQFRPPRNPALMPSAEIGNSVGSNQTNGLHFNNYTEYTQYLQYLQRQFGGVGGVGGG